MDGTMEERAEAMDRTVHPAGRAVGIWAAWIAFFTVADLLSKAVVRVLLMEPTWHDVTVIPGFFSLSPALNKGIAFSLFADESSPWKPVVLVGIAVLVLLWFAWMTVKGVIRRPAWLMAAGMIGGGTVGNAVNRLQTGSVVDFLDFHVGNWAWPTFNLADTFICVGVGLLALFLILEEREKR